MHHLIKIKTVSKDTAILPHYLFNGGGKDTKWALQIIQCAFLASIDVTMYFNTQECHKPQAF